LTQIINNGCYTILRRKTVQSRTGLSRSSIYLKISKGTFPKPINLGARAVGWLENDIDNWINGCIQASASNTTTGGCQ
jgi:prophage regulatory protein